MKSLKIPNGEVICVKLPTGNKWYNLILNGIVANSVVKRSTAVSWYRNRVKRYVALVGIDPPEDMFAVEEVKRRRIK